MGIQYGVTPAGFVAKQQQIIIAEIITVLQQTFGSNINTGAESVFGQLVGIFSEREALLWQLAEAVYDSQYPDGAEGSSVDNILALTNLKRLPATPTITNNAPLVDPITLVTLYGLLLYGTPGTIVPAGSIIQTSATPPLNFTLDNPTTINAPVNAIQTIFLSNTPNQGAFQLLVTTVSDNQYTSPAIQWNADAVNTLLLFSANPVTGAFELTLTQAGVALTTASIPFGANAAAIQAAINGLSGYSGVTVTGTSFMTGFTINWGSIIEPITTVTANTLGVTASVVDSVQAIITNIQDTLGTNKYPFTDVTVANNVPGYVITFGGTTPLAGQPSSGDQQIPILQETNNTLQFTATVTNIDINNTQMGSPAKGIATATCTVDGPNFVGAGTLSIIGSPTSGWTGVTNQLDCVTGTNVEDDTQALIRRSNLLNAQANGPLQAIVEKVQSVAGVTAAIGFENLNEAALQIVTFGTTPPSGHFKLAIGPLSSTFINFNATAADVQTALRTIAGFGATLVTGSIGNGFTVDFNGTDGGQPQPLMTVQSNTTGVTITPSFGRPGKSFEIVAQGGTDQAVALAIYNSKPAGIQTYGSTSVVIQDVFGNPYTINFSRPTQVPIFMVINLVTDLQTSSQPKFNPSSIPTIQQDLINIGNLVGIGGTIIGFGTNGLVGAFNSVPGITSYTISFGTSANPTMNVNIPLLPEQVPLFETFNIIVSYT